MKKSVKYVSINDIIEELIKTSSKIAKNIAGIIAEAKKINIDFVNS